MGERFPGGVISKTPPTVTPPTGGEGGSASGVWSLDEVLDYEKAGAWPKRVLPRDLYAWGFNSTGQVGDETVTNKSSPVQIGFNLQWESVAQGGTRAHNVAITTNNALWAWGSNGSGRLGDNTTINKSSPIQIGSLTDWAQSAVGNSFTSSVKTDGTLWTWGLNSNGRLGDNTVIDRSSPVQVGALTNWAQVAANAQGLAIKTDGTLWAWGTNSQGQLGDNTIINSSSPVQIGALSDWAQVAAGDLHTAAIKTDGTLWTWGFNGQGQLGDGAGFSTLPRRSSPVQVGALTNWAQVSASSAICAAIKTDGTLWGWGDNSPSGVIGDGTVIDKSSPVQVGALTNWSQVSLSSTAAAAIKTDGTLWAWGNNFSGNVGDNTAVSKSSPVQIGAATNWQQVATPLAITKG